MTKDSGKDSGIAAAIRKRWRAWLRAIHRDVGYLAVGFTIIYAVSGIAINHRGDSFNPDQSTSIERRGESSSMGTSGSTLPAAGPVRQGTGGARRLGPAG